jgi:hypothetical protein
MIVRKTAIDSRDLSLNLRMVRASIDLIVRFNPGMSRVPSIYFR